MSDLIGRTLGHYRVVEKIGAGGMGVVYRAHDERLDREVAVKVLPEAVAEDAERLTRFDREAKAVGSLNHPNILTVHEIDTFEGQPFIVTELLEGETLREVVGKGGISSRKAVEYARHVAKGLAAAHDKGITHRDLKPENIFLTQDGHIKILDFGLAKLLQPDTETGEVGELPTETLRTSPGIVMGTPGYMAPEQLQGMSVDHRSDIFAFGVVLYEMLAGKRPFQGDSKAQVAASILRDEPPTLSGSVRAVSPTLDRIVQQCLEKRPKDRFESARDLAHMLRAVSDTGEVSTTFPMTLKKRSWLRLVAAAVAISVAIAVAAVVGWELLNKQPAPGIPEVKHIAVLPFESVGDDPESWFLAAGFAEAVTDGLTIMERETRGATWVVPPSPGLTLDEVRKVHNATMVVRGLYNQGVERVRLDLQLVDTATGQTLARRTLDESVRNLTDLQKEPVRMVWEMLGFEATPAALADLDEFSTNTVIAFRAYVSGRGRLSTAGDESELQAAVASLEQAVQEDPGFAPARVALARAFALLFEETRDERWKERAVAEANYAIDLDDDAAEPYLVLGEVYGSVGESELGLEAHRHAAARAKTARPFYLLGKVATEAGEFDEAERALQTAINLRPDCFKEHHSLGFLYVQMGRYDAAANEFRHAIRAAPENLEAQINLGAILYYQDRREEARKVFEDALALEPSAAAYSNLGTLYFEEARYGDAVEMFESAVALAGEDLPADQYVLVGNQASAQYWGGERDRARVSYQRAIELAEESLAKNSENPSVMADLAGYCGMVGRHDRGIELLEAVTRKKSRDPYLMGTIAESFEDLGERERAVEWIGKALDNGLTVNWIERTPTFNNLREDERFKSMLEKYEAD